MQNEVTNGFSHNAIMRHKLFILLTLFACAIVSTNIAHARTVECVEKDISNYQWRVRHRAALPAILDAMPNEIIQGCAVLTGVGDFPLVLIKVKGLEVSVNDSEYATDKPQTIREGDKIAFRFHAGSGSNRHKTVRLTFQETNKESRRKLYRVTWQVQTANTPREPKIWRLGPNHMYREVSDILPHLAAGDTVLLEANATYTPFEARFISGTQDRPIRIIGDTKVAGERPVFSGGTEKYNWTIALRSSHNWTIENIILQDGGLCFRHEAHNITLKNVLIRRCGMAVLGTDLNSGNLTILNSEITESGGKTAGKSWRHAVYVASDQHSFPGSIFTLKNSFLHSNKGNTIKSRFQNTLIEQNWIESGRDLQAKYLVELIGYDGRFDFHGQNHRVRDNIMLHRAPGLGSRVGGDGNSASRGDAIFENNLFLIEPGYNRTLVRTFQGLRSLTVTRNRLAYIDQPGDLTLVTDELENPQWASGYPIITIQENVVPNSTKFLKRIYSKEDQNNTAGITVQDNKRVSPVIISNKEVAKHRPSELKYVDKTRHVEDFARAS